MADREPGVMLWTAETWTRDERHVESWVAEYGECAGVGTTPADALRSLADDLDRQELLETVGVV